MALMIGLEKPAEPGTKVRVVPSPFGSAPEYVGLTGEVDRVITTWQGDDGAWRTQYRVIMDSESEDNMRILREPPTGALGPLWNPEGPFNFIMLDHELEELECIDVAFRVDKHGTHKGEVTAVFSGVPDTWGLMCYAHGQHVSCTREWYKDQTRPATDEESVPLMKELQGRGYIVTPVKRVRWA